MRNVLKFLAALSAAMLLMLAFRALFFTIYTVEGAALEPTFTAGDRILVNRWSYGLRTGGNRFFSYTRWMGAQPQRDELVAFNLPTDTAHTVANRAVYLCYCKALPGDTITVGGQRLQLPGRRHIVRVTPTNMYFISFIYNRYEGCKATVRGGNLYVDGRIIRCAAFTKDYYWMSSGERSNCNDSRFFGPVPDDHLIGKASMLLYSIDSARPLYDCLRSGRTLLFINSGTTAQPQCKTCD